MPIAFHFKFVLLLWQIDMIDSFTFVQFYLNSSTEYSAMVLENPTSNSYHDITLKTLLEPILGLQTAYKYIKLAETVFERHWHQIQPQMLLWVLQ